MEEQKSVVHLKNLLINNQKQIGIQFYPKKVVEWAVKSLEDINWHEEYGYSSS